MKSFDGENIDSENPPCLIFYDGDAYIVKKSNGYKYLIFASKNKNKNVLRILWYAFW